MAVAVAVRLPRPRRVRPTEVVRNGVGLQERYGMAGRAEVLVDPPTRPFLGVESGIVVPTPAPSAGRRHKEFV